MAVELAVAVFAGGMYFAAGWHWYTFAALAVIAVLFTRVALVIV